MSIDYTDKTLVAQIDRYEISESEHATFALHVQRRRLILLILAIEGITFLGMTFVFQYSLTVTAIVLTIYAITLAVAAYLMIRLFARRAHRQLGDPTGFVTIFEEGIRSSSKQAERWMPWNSFIGYRVLPFGIALHVNALQGLPLPKRVFKSDEDWVNALKLVESHLALLK